MRLYEIINQTEVMKSNSKIEYAMREFFHLEPKDYSITKGLVDVRGSCKLFHNLENLPVKFRKVGQDFIISSSELTTLEGCPYEVGQNFYAAMNQLTSIVGGPRTVGKDFSVIDSPLESLDGLPNSIGDSIYLTIKENTPLLRLLFIDNLKGINLYDTNETRLRPIEDILKKYLRQGQRGAIACAAELTKAGFKGNARL